MNGASLAIQALVGRCGVVTSSLPGPQPVVAGFTAAAERPPGVPVSVSYPVKLIRDAASNLHWECKAHADSCERCMPLSL